MAPSLYRYGNWADTNDGVDAEDKAPVAGSSQRHHHHLQAPADAAEAAAEYLYHHQQQQLSAPQLAFNEAATPAEKKAEVGSGAIQLAYGRSLLVPTTGGHGGRYHAAAAAGVGVGGAANRRDTRRQFKFGKKSVSTRFASDDVGDQLSDFGQFQLDKTKSTTSHKRKMIKFGKKSISASAINVGDGLAADSAY